MDAKPARHAAARRANHLALGCSVLPAIDRIVITGFHFLGLLVMMGAAMDAADAQPQVVPVTYAGQAVPEAVDHRPALWTQAVVTAGSLLVTLLYLWSFFGLAVRTSWRFVVGIHWVVLLMSAIRALALVLLALAMSTFAWLQVGLWAIMQVGAAWKPALWSIAVVVSSSIAIGALTRRHVMELYGIEQPLVRSHRRRARA